MGAAHRLTPSPQIGGFSEAGAGTPTEVFYSTRSPNSGQMDLSSLSPRQFVSRSSSGHFLAGTNSSRIVSFVLVPTSSMVGDIWGILYSLTSGSQSNFRLDAEFDRCLWGAIASRPQVVSSMYGLERLPSDSYLSDTGR